MSTRDSPPRSMSAYAFKVSELWKVFERREGAFRQRTLRKEALRGLNFEVDVGGIFGLIGPNGAGKTTFVRILATLLLPSSGKAEVLGYDVVRSPNDVRRRVALVLGGDLGLYTRVSGRRNLEYFADLYGVPRQDAKIRIQQLLDAVDLTEAADTPVELYSRGMKQRLHIARGLVHKPELLILDEPTNGLDPKGARLVRELIRNIAGEGFTVLLTTHQMFEAEELCEKVAVISRGKVVASGSLQKLKDMIGGPSVTEIEGYGFTNLELDSLRAAAHGGEVAVADFGSRQIITIRSGNDAELTEEVQRLQRSGRSVSVRQRRTNLEDVYLSLTEE